MKTNPLPNLYQETLIKLKNGQRPQIRLTPELALELKVNWQESLLEALCVLNHTQNTSAEFNELIFTTFDKKLDQETLIFLLGASQKHIVSHSLMLGVVIPAEFFEILKNLLQTKNPEVLEWTLRTVESMGPLNRRLQNEIRRSRPGPMKFINSHLRACNEIINLLEEQWKK